MKSTRNNKKPATKKLSNPFFNKGDKEAFFAAKKEKNTPFFQPKLIQAELAVGTPNDPFEQEADKVGHQVMENFGQVSGVQAKLAHLGLQPALIQPKPIGTRISRLIQRRQAAIQTKCAGCEEEEMAQPKSAGIQLAGNGGMASPEIEQKINNNRGGGQAMDVQTKSAMEASFGADFSGVKIHTGSTAVQMSQDLNAHAFTVGNDIFFNEGRYRPQTKEGAGLLAHELTHTVQQGAAVQNKKINRTPLSRMLSKHSMAHLSTMNNDALSRKEVAQLEQVPEEELMQQREIFESGKVDKVQKKDSKLSLRKCSGTKKPKQTITMSGAKCGAKYGAVGKYCYSGANGWWFKEKVKGTSEVCQPGSIDQTTKPFQARGNCISDQIFNFNGPPSKIAPCKDVTKQIVYTGPTKDKVEQFEYHNEQIIEVTQTSNSPKKGKVKTSSGGVSTECDWP